MEPYANLSGRSGVFQYEIGKEWIMIMFDKGEIRTYNYDEYGEDDVEEMKQLAKSGEGLNRFLNENYK